MGVKPLVYGIAVLLGSVMSGQDAPGDGSSGQTSEWCVFEDGAPVGPVCVEIEDVGENIGT